VCGQGSSPLRAVSCQVFPISDVDVQSLHIFLAGVTVAELRAACASLARGKLAVEDVLWYSTILHAADMSKPSKPTLAQQSEHGGYTSLGKDLCVGDLVLPCDSKYAAKAAHMEGIQSLFLPGVGSP